MALINVTNATDSQIILDDVVFQSDKPTFGITRVRNCDGLTISTKDMRVVSSHGGGAEAVLNQVEKSKRTTILQDDTKVTGNFSKLTMNKVVDCDDTVISQKNVVVRQRDRGRTPYSGGGELVVNDIAGSTNTNIDQTDMKITGQFDDVNLNKMQRSKGTKINQDGMTVDIDDFEDHYPQRYHRPTPPSDRASTREIIAEPASTDQMQKPAPPAATQSTPPRRYYNRPKLQFKVVFPQAGNISFNLDDDVKVRYPIETIKSVNPTYHDKDFRLKNKKTGDLVTNNLEMTLKDAGIETGMKFDMVDIRPSSDY